MAKARLNTATPDRPRMAGTFSAETTSISMAGMMATRLMLKWASRVVSMMSILVVSMSPDPYCRPRTM